ncbi:MAG: hypothetical protein ABI906_09740 [Pseudomonadota bacterium]
MVAIRGSSHESRISPTVRKPRVRPTRTSAKCTAAAKTTAVAGK